MTVGTVPGASSAAAATAATAALPGVAGADAAAQTGQTPGLADGPTGPAVDDTELSPGVGYRGVLSAGYRDWVVDAGGLIRNQDPRGYTLHFPDDLHPFIRDWNRAGGMMQLRPTNTLTTLLAGVTSVHRYVRPLSRLVDIPIGHITALFAVVVGDLATLATTPSTVPAMTFIRSSALYTLAALSPGDVETTATAILTDPATPPDLIRQTFQLLGALRVYSGDTAYSSLVAALSPETHPASTRLAALRALRHNSATSFNDLVPRLVRVVYGDEDEAVRQEAVAVLGDLAEKLMTHRRTAESVKAIESAVDDEIGRMSADLLHLLSGSTLSDNDAGALHTALDHVRIEADKTIRNATANPTAKTHAVTVLAALGELASDDWVQLLRDGQGIPTPPVLNDRVIEKVAGLLTENDIMLAHRVQNFLKTLGTRGLLAFVHYIDHNSGSVQGPARVMLRHYNKPLIEAMLDVLSGAPLTPPNTIDTQPEWHKDPATPSRIVKALEEMSGDTATAIMNYRRRLQTEARKGFPENYLPSKRLDQLDKALHRYYDWVVQQDLKSLRVSLVWSLDVKNRLADLHHISMLSLLNLVLDADRRHAERAADVLLAIGAPALKGLDGIAEFSTPEIRARVEDLKAKLVQAAVRKLVGSTNGADNAQGLTSE